MMMEVTMQGKFVFLSFNLRHGYSLVLISQVVPLMILVVTVYLYQLTAIGLP